MDDLTITTWLWGDKYGQQDVAKLYSGLFRSLKQKFRFILFSDKSVGLPLIETHSIEDIELTKVPGCFARLRMFDPAWQDKWRIRDRIVCIDLDTIITANLDPLFKRPEPYVILQGANSVNPCPYTGALQMLRTGHHADVWSDFSLEAAQKIKFYEFPDDQAWIWHTIPGAAGWKAGVDGVYAFKKPGWPRGTDYLPRDARLVTFNGWRSPRKFNHLNWVKQFWVS